MVHYFFYASLFIFIASIISSWVWVKVFYHLSWKYNFLDNPKTQTHKIHSKPVALLGGAGLLAGFITVLALVFFLCYYVEKFSFIYATLVGKLLSLATLAFGALGLFCVGLYDDVKPLSAYAKLVFQSIFAGIVALYGFEITLFVDSGFLNWLITCCWIVFIINAINFFDNMDGLASGVSVVITFFLAIVALVQGQILVGLLGCVTSGIALGFYLHNSFPARIFMGDSGSHFLGYLIACLAGMVTYYDKPNISFIPFLIPLFILALPIFDTLMVFLLRKLKGQSIFKGDNNHLSHRFVEMGFSVRVSVYLILILQVMFGLLALSSLYSKSYEMSLFFIIQAFLLLGFVIVLQTKQGKNKNDD